jgi:hypothetical protein
MILSQVSVRSFQSDGDVPLLDEMVSPGPKGVLIKEAKVKKPSTVPLVNPVASSKVCITCKMERTVFCSVTPVEFQQLFGGTVCFHFTPQPCR